MKPITNGGHPNDDLSIFRDEVSWFWKKLTKEFLETEAGKQFAKCFEPEQYELDLKD